MLLAAHAFLPIEIAGACGFHRRGVVRIMLGRKTFSVFAALIFFIVAAFAVSAMTAATPDKNALVNSEKVRVETPLNLAILVQDDLVSRVGNELDVARFYPLAARRLARDDCLREGRIIAGSTTVYERSRQSREVSARARRQRRCCALQSLCGGRRGAPQV